MLANLGFLGPVHPYLDNAHIMAVEPKQIPLCQQSCWDQLACCSCKRALLQQLNPSKLFSVSRFVGPKWFATAVGAGVDCNAAPTRALSIICIYLRIELILWCLNPSKLLCVGRIAGTHWLATAVRAGVDSNAAPIRTF